MTFRYSNDRYGLWVDVYPPEMRRLPNVRGLRELCGL